MPAKDNFTPYDDEWWEEQGFLTEQQLSKRKSDGFNLPFKGFSYKACNHWQQRVRIGKRYTVTCSAGISIPKESGPIYPDFGVYLDAEWFGKITTTGCRIKAVAERAKYPAMFVEWVDYRELPADKLDLVVKVCLSKMRHGKWIDIGCHHAHGRTGTLLACLIAAVEHLDSRAAIDAVHERYCHSAIESESQKESIRKFVLRYRVKTVYRRNKNNRLKKGE